MVEDNHDFGTCRVASSKALRLNTHQGRDLRLKLVSKFSRIQKLLNSRSRAQIPDCKALEMRIRTRKRLRTKYLCGGESQAELTLTTPPPPVLSNSGYAEEDKIQPKRRWDDAIKMIKSLMLSSLQMISGAIILPDETPSS